MMKTDSDGTAGKQENWMYVGSPRSRRSKVEVHRKQMKEIANKIDWKNRKGGNGRRRVDVTGDEEEMVYVWR